MSEGCYESRHSTFYLHLLPSPERILGTLPQVFLAYHVHMRSWNTGTKSGERDSKRADTHKGSKACFDGLLEKKEREE